MPWTTPKTWVSEVLTSDDMNTYLSDNTQFLYDEVTYTPGEYTYTRLTAVDYSTTSEELVDIDSTNMLTTITTGGGDVRVTFAASAYRSGGTSMNTFFAVLIDGNIYQPIRVNLDINNNVSFSYVFNNISAGSHQFRMRWRRAIGATGTLNLYGQHAHFSVRELKK